MNTTMNIDKTRQPDLTRAVIEQTDIENLEDICRHGADAGFAGFTYYSDTVPFAEANKALIFARLNRDAAEFGFEGPLSLLASFRCLKGMSQEEIAEGLYDSASEHREQVFNALAWYAAEEIARELNPEL